MTLALGAACTYDSHRRSDWLRRSLGVLACGVCHPPLGVPAEDVATRADRDFEQIIRSSQGGQVRHTADAPDPPEPVL